MAPFKNLVVWSAVATLCFAAPARADDACPDFTTDACLKEIRQNIERVRYDAARDGAELQCYEKPEGGPAVELSEPVLLAQASGCYFLYSLEKFLGHSMKAVEAQERTREMAAWSCNHGFDSLCEVSLGLIRLQFAALMGEVKGDLKRDSAVKEFKGAGFREISGGRVLPRSFIDASAKDLREAFKASGISLTDCKDCRPAAKDRAAMSAGTAKRALDAELTLVGSELKLDLRLFEVDQAKIVWQKSYQTHDLSARQRLFGFNASVPPMVAEAKRLDEYEPNYKFLVGLGSARIPNISGSGRDASRGVVQVRALERFHSGHSEVGMMLSFHATQRTLDKRLKRVEADDDEDEADEPDPDSAAGTEPEPADDDEDPELPPYPTSLGLYFVYGHMFFDGRENYDSIRHGLTAGFGGVMTNSVLAGTYRLSWDAYFGRRVVLSPGFVYVGKSTLEIGKDRVSTKPVSGGEVVLSLNL